MQELLSPLDHSRILPKQNQAQVESAILGRGAEIIRTSVTDKEEGYKQVTTIVQVHQVKMRRNVIRTWQIGTDKHDTVQTLRILSITNTQHL